MRKLNFNLKKNMTVSVLLIIALGLGIGLIAYTNKGSAAKDNKVLAEENKKVNVNEVTNAYDKKEVNPASDDSAEKKTQNNLDAISPQVVSNESAKKEETPKKPDPPKEKPKTQDNITDKNKVPTYTEKEVKPNVDTTPKSGEKNSSGQAYVPGFGWVKDSGSNSSVKVNSSGDINKQVGKMD